MKGSYSTVCIDALSGDEEASVVTFHEQRLRGSVNFRKTLQMSDLDGPGALLISCIVKYFNYRSSCIPFEPSLDALSLRSNVICSIKILSFQITLP